MLYAPFACFPSQNLFVVQVPTEQSALSYEHTHSGFAEGPGVSCPDSSVPCSLILSLTRLEPFHRHSHFNWPSYLGLHLLEATCAELSSCHLLHRK